MVHDGESPPGDQLARIEIGGHAQIAKMEPGDVLIVRTQLPVGEEIRKRIGESVRNILPDGVRVMVADMGMDVSILRPPKIDQLHEDTRGRGPDEDFLRWIAERLVNIYGESPNVDFVLRLREMAAKEEKSSW